MICGHEPERPSAEIRSSSAFLSTSARKLQNTGRDRLLDKAQAEVARIKIEILQGIAGDCRHMMYA